MCIRLKITMWSLLFIMVLCLFCHEVFADPQVPPCFDPDGEPYLTGDCNGDDTVNISDVVCFAELLASGQLPVIDARCDQRLDFNGDNYVSGADLTCMINWLFNGGPGPTFPVVCCQISIHDVQHM